MEPLQSKTMKLVNVGISEFGVSKSIEETLVTYSLGTCVGVSLYDPVATLGGIIHCMLPTQGNNHKDAPTNPICYVDTGFVIFLQKLFDMGATRKNLICKVVGCGGKHSIENDMFRIGERNYTMIKKVLWKNSILIRGELVGGAEAKTMYLQMSSGRVLVRNGAIDSEI